MGDSSGDVEDQNDNRKADSKDYPYQASKKNKDSVDDWTRGFSYYNLGKQLMYSASIPKFD